MSSSMLKEEKIDEISGYNLTYLSLAFKYNFYYVLQQANNTREAIERMNFQESEPGLLSLLSGSRAEGLCLPIVRHGYIFVKCDVDKMNVFENVVIHSQKCTNKTVNRRCMYITDGPHPGYCHLLSCNSNNELPSGNVREVMRKHANDVWPGAYAENDLSTALTFTQDMKPKFGQSLRMSTDVVFAYKLNDWPAQAMEWIHRERAGTWPSQHLISEVVSRGCHIVPKPHPLSLSNNHEWRISFSAAELFIGASLTQEQRFCYLVAKVLLKFEELVHSQTLMKTYFLKTAMYWLCEELNEEEWSWRNVGRNVLRLLDIILTFFEQKVLPSYFIPENNLIEHLNETSFDYRKTIEILKNIRQHPFPAMLSCKQYSFYSSIVFSELFEPINDVLLTTTTDYNRIIQVLMKISTRHFESREFKYALLPFEELCEYLDKFEDQLDFPVIGWFNNLAYCYSRTGDNSKCLKFSEKVLHLFTSDEDADISQIGGLLLNIAYLYFAKALGCTNPKQKIKLLEDVRNRLLLAKSFYDENNESTHRSYSIWLVHFANFCLRTEDFSTAEVMLKQSLSIIPSSHIVANDIMLTPCEINTTDDMTRNFFHALSEGGKILRYDYDRYPDNITIPTMLWTHYLYVELETKKGNFNEASKYAELLEIFVNSYMPVNISTGMMPLHWYTYLGHCFLKVSNIEKAEFYFDKRYVGPRCDVALNKYHMFTLEFHKLSNMYQCFAL